MVLLCVSTNCLHFVKARQITALKSKTNFFVCLPIVAYSANYRDFLLTVSVTSVKYLGDRVFHGKSRGFEQDSYGA